MVGQGLGLFEHLDGHLGGLQNVFQGTRRDCSATLHRDNGITLRVTEMTYQQMATALTKRLNANRSIKPYLRIRRRNTVSCSGVTASKTPKMVVFIPTLLPELRSPGLDTRWQRAWAPALAVHRDRGPDRDPLVHQVLWVILYRVPPDDHAHADGFGPPAHTPIPRFASCLRADDSHAM